MPNVNSSLKLSAILAVGIGGVIGTLLRYFVSSLLAESMFFPWDTIIVNIIGSFILALILSVTLNKTHMNKIILSFFSTGIIGSFTTFSTIIIDLALLAQVSMFLSFIYFFVTIIGGLTFALLGLVIGKGFG